MKNLLGYHGCSFSATIDGRDCEGKIFVEGDSVYLCQDVIKGSTPEQASNLWGYKFSWVVEDGQDYFLRQADVTNFRLGEDSKEYETEDKVEHTQAEKLEISHIDELIDFVVWYSGMEREKVISAYKRYLTEIK